MSSHIKTKVKAILSEIFNPLNNAQKIFRDDLFNDLKVYSRTNVAEQRKVRNEAKIKRPPVVTDDCDNFFICTLIMFYAFFCVRLIFRSYFSRPLCATCPFTRIRFR